MSIPDLPIFHRLSDEHLSAIDCAAWPLMVGDRLAFYEAVDAALQGVREIGSGSLHRVLRSTMAEFLRERPLIPNEAAARRAVSKYSRVRTFVHK